MGNAAFSATIARAPAVPARPGGGTDRPRDALDVALAQSVAARRPRAVARDTEVKDPPPPTQELRDAADAAQKADAISKEAGGVTNVKDAAAAQEAMRKIDDGSRTLDLITSVGETNLVGDGSIPQLKAENAATRQQVELYAGFLGEETRTGVDFTDRYKKAHAQFARLDAMAKQYEATYGTSAQTSKGILEGEAGAQSAKEAAQRFETDRGKLSPEKSADLTGAMTKLEATENEMSKVKADVMKASEDARMGFRDASSATAKVKKAAEDEKSEEKKKEVEAVKGKIAEMAKLISTPLQIGYDLGEAAVTGGASAAVDAGKAKAIAAAKEIPGQVAQGVGQVAAEKYYEAELVRAESAQKIAATLSSGYAAEIGGNEVKNAADKWSQQMRVLRDQSKRFDEVQQTLRRNIQDVGRAADAAGLGKEFGARYKMIAEFRAEATLFVNEADLAIKLGEENVSAMNEGNERRSAAAYQDGKDTMRRYWTASRPAGTKWLLTANNLHLQIKSTQGEGGGKEVVQALVDELKGYRKSAETYRATLAQSMGGQ
jgi:hypothetical protein